MNWFTGIVVYLLTWWVVIFAVLPLGNAAQEKRADPGMADGAPAKPRLAFKFLLTTAISAAIWLAIYALVRSDIISFHDMAERIQVE